MKKILLLVSCLWAGPVVAEVPCMPLANAMAEITGPRYSEVPLFDATVGEYGTVKVTANAATGTWTLMLIRKDPPMACIVMAGRDFRPATVEGEPM